jgi:hypothetical protein
VSEGANWLLRIVFACLGFAVVWFGLPWALALIFGITWPTVIIGLIALVVFLLIITRHVWWSRFRTPV